MTITSLVENTSRENFPVEHGLSLHIRLEDGRQILFDMGQGNLFARNAEHVGLRLSKVDMAIVSHGHYDHGGGLGTFLEINRHAPVYLNNHAFEPHYSLRDKGLAYIGLNPKLKGNERLISCEEVVSIDNGILLFADVTDDCLCPTGNKLLFGPTPDINDDFCHEQSLLIEENGKTVLFGMRPCRHRKHHAESHPLDRPSPHPYLCRDAPREKRITRNGRNSIHPCTGRQTTGTSRMPLLHHALHRSPPVPNPSRPDERIHQLPKLRRKRNDIILTSHVKNSGLSLEAKKRRNGFRREEAQAV